MSGFTENSLVEQPAIDLFAELKWGTANCFYELSNNSPSPKSSPRGRGNVDLPEEAIDLAVEELTKDRR